MHRRKANNPRKKENVPFKAKVCTVISGALVLGLGVFSVYADVPIAQ